MSLVERKWSGMGGRGGLYRGERDCFQHNRHGVGIWISDFGGMYIGEWKNGEIEGWGVWYSACGYVYGGSWKAGMFHGAGRQVDQHGNYADGTWVHDQKHGAFVIHYINGGVSWGTMEQGKRHGFHVDKWPGGASVRTIQYEHGRPVGQGVWASAQTREIYVGQYKNISEANEYREGAGVFLKHVEIPPSAEHTSWLDLVKCRDEFVRDELHNGSILCLRGLEVYCGEWKNNVRHGFGKQSYASGEWYQGEWRGDKPEGSGSCLRLDNNGLAAQLYTGQFRNGRYEGLGRILHLPHAIYYEGGFRHSSKHGFGVKAWDNRDVLVGEWQYGALHGAALLRWACGPTVHIILNHGLFLCESGDSNWHALRHTYRTYRICRHAGHKN